MNCKAWKAVHVISGSIIEALLADYLMSVSTYTGTTEEVCNMGLAVLIRECTNAGILTEKAANLSHVVRGYRNLIHPGRMQRLGETVDEEGAKIALSLVEIIVKEVSTLLQKSYGYTAEQIVSKIENDPSCTSILVHILKEAKEREIKQLLLNTIPTKYIDLLQQEIWDDDVDTEQARLALRRGFWEAYELSSEETKQSVMKKTVAILKEESEWIVLLYEANFLLCSELKYLSSEEIEIVKKHILSRLKKEGSGQIINALSGIGKYLISTDVNSFIDPLTRELKQGKETPQPVFSCLSHEGAVVIGEIMSKFDERLNAWESSFLENKDDIALTRLKELKADIAWERIDPFADD